MHELHVVRAGRIISPPLRFGGGPDRSRVSNSAVGSLRRSLASMRAMGARMRPDVHLLAVACAIAALAWAVACAAPADAPAAQAEAQQPPASACAYANDGTCDEPWLVQGRHRRGRLRARLRVGRAAAGSPRVHVRAKPVAAPSDAARVRLARDVGADRHLGRHHRGARREAGHDDRPLFPGPRARALRPVEAHADRLHAERLHGEHVRPRVVHRARSHRRSERLHRRLPRAAVPRLRAGDRLGLRVARVHERVDARRPGRRTPISTSSASSPRS